MQRTPSPTKVHQWNPEAPGHQHHWKESDPPTSHRPKHHMTTWLRGCETPWSGLPTPWDAMAFKVLSNPQSPSNVIKCVIYLYCLYFCCVFPLQIFNVFPTFATGIEIIHLFISSTYYTSTSSVRSSWWFQPIWKILVKLVHFPKKGWTIKNIWNHHPVLLGSRTSPP